MQESQTRQKAENRNRKNKESEPLTSTNNEVEEMKYFLSSPTVFRYSKFNSDELNKSNERDERVSSTESVEKWGMSGITVKP